MTKFICQTINDEFFITVLKASNPFGKTIKLDDNNKIITDYIPMPEGSEGFVKGFYTLKQFADYMNEVQKDKKYRYAFVYAIPKNNITNFTVAYKRKENIAENKLAISKDNFIFTGRGILFLDVDKTPVPPEVLFERMWRSSHIFNEVEFFWRHSSSAFIFNKKTNEYIVEHYGHRFYAIVENMEDIKEFTTNLIAHLSGNKDNMRKKIDPDGRVEKICIFDNMAEPNRMDIISPPIVHSPLVQIPQEYKYFGGEKTFNKERMKWFKRNKPPKIINIKQPPTALTVQKCEEKYGKSIYDKLRKNILPANWVLYLENGKTILAGDCHKYIGSQLADPREPKYNNDKRIAIILQDGTIYSHAHGKNLYTVEKFNEEATDNQADDQAHNPNHEIHEIKVEQTNEYFINTFKLNKKNILLIAPPGTGKTYSMIHYITDLIKKDPKAKIGIAVQNEKIGMQIVDVFTDLGQNAILYKGFTKNCIKYDKTEIELFNKELISASIFGVSTNLCAKKDSLTAPVQCEFYDKCPYIKQKNQLAKANVVIFPQQLLFIPSAIQYQKFQILFVDEDPYWAKLHSSKIKTTDQLLMQAFNNLTEKQPISCLTELKTMAMLEIQKLKARNDTIKQIINPNSKLRDLKDSIADILKDYPVNQKLIDCVTILENPDIHKVVRDPNTIEYVKPIGTILDCPKIIHMDATPYIDLYKRILPDLHIVQLKCTNANKPLNIFIKADIHSKTTKSDVYNMSSLKKETTLKAIKRVVEKVIKDFGGVIGVISSKECIELLNALVFSKPVKFMNFNCRGINDFENIDALIVVGKITPNSNHLRQMYNFIYNTEFLPEQDRYQPTYTIIQNVRVAYFKSIHKYISEIAEKFMYQLIHQAKERMRTIRGNPNRLCIFFGVPPIKDIEYDYCLTLDEFMEANFEIKRKDSENTKL